MNNYKLLIAYDGTSFSGWQVQPNAISIQQKIEEALEIILKHPVAIVGSGRTDAGVHAMGQVAHFKCEHEIDVYRLRASLNGLLPKDIRILDVQQVDLNFHAQKSAIRKTYHYHLFLNPVMHPCLRLYRYHFHGKINIALLFEAAARFHGQHDFTAFANEAHSGAASKNPIRTIEKLAVMEEEGGIRLEFTADGFLYKMVRNITGTMLDVASGKKDIQEIDEIFASKDRRKASLAAPPQGLFLMQVDYPAELLISSSKF